MSAPDGEDLSGYMDEVDVRAVSIIWAEDAAAIDVAFSGCSVYEAIGMAVVAALRLVAAECADDEEDE